ncbi:MAG: hypothetical protein WC455_07255 [Dehalococcoidia bacterium]|jgi:hypothetical protein
MSKSERQLTFEVWDCVNDGDTVEKIANELQIDEDRVRRLGIVLKELKKGSKPEQIIKKLNGKWTTKVEKCTEWFPEYKLRKSPVRDDIKQTLTKLQNRIINPHYDEQFLVEESTWYYGGEDWRLTPDGWLRLMIPDLKVWSKWPARYDKLKEYEGSESFCQHYDELEQMVQSLNSDLKQAAQQVAIRMPVFGDIWKNLNEALTNYCMTLIKPSRETKFSPDEIEPLPYPDDEFCNMVLDDFEALIPDLKVRYREIEQKFQQVCDDLDNMVG